jgi:hypothetical protein
MERHSGMKVNTQVCVRVEIKYRVLEYPEHLKLDSATFLNICCMPSVGQTRHFYIQYHI